MQPGTDNGKTPLIYLIESLPGFEHYGGGGAEKVMERLVFGVARLYPDRYAPTLLVANRKEAENATVYPFPLVTEPEVEQLIDLVEARNNPRTPLHIGTAFLMLHHPDLFRHLGAFWQGPLIQRIPLASELELIAKRLGDDFPAFLSPVDAFISQSDQMSATLQALGIPEGKIAQIENGIDLEQKRALPEEERRRLRSELFPGISASDTVFLFAGRLYDADKKVEDLLRAWLEGGFATAGHHLVLAGEYAAGKPTQEKLASFLRHFSPEAIRGSHIHFTGFLDEAALARYYQAADVYVTPSGLEGFSNAQLEALAFGLPVIGRAGVSGNEHLILPGETGLLYASLEEMKERMWELSRDPELRRSLGAGGRLQAEKHFSIDGMVAKYDALYTALLEKTL